MWTRERHEYRGELMRSRVEVAWAQYFDGYEMPWEYEPVKFWRYRPDFGLLDRQVFVEVKGKNMPLNNHLWSCQYPLLLVIGYPDKNPEMRLLRNGVFIGRVADFWRTYHDLELELEHLMPFKDARDPGEDE